MKRIRLALSVWLSAGLSLRRRHIALRCQSFPAPPARCSCYAPSAPAGLPIHPNQAPRPGPPPLHSPRQPVRRMHPRCGRPCRRTGPWARTCIQSRVGHVHANGRLMCRRHHTHRKPNRRRRRRPRSKPTRPGRPSTARSSHAPGRPTTPLSASTKQPFASPHAGPHPGDVTPSPGPPHLPFFIFLRGGSAGRSLPASHAPQPYNSRYTECPRPTPQFNELNHAKVGRLHRCAFRIT